MACSVNSFGLCHLSGVVNCAVVTDPIYIMIGEEYELVPYSFSSIRKRLRIVEYGEEDKTLLRKIQLIINAD